MTADSSVRFDVQALRAIAGDAVFDRGQDYQRRGLVDLLAVDRERVLAEVHGTVPYRVIVYGRGTRIDGECTCPAYETWGFCKHLVATALATNAVRMDVSANARLDATDRLRKYLQDQSATQLVDTLVLLAERDLAVFRWLDWRATDGGDLFANGQGPPDPSQSDRDEDA